MKFAVCEEYLKFINQFINDSMVINCHSDIHIIKISLKKCTMGNQSKDLKLKKDKKRLSQTRKEKSVKRELENARMLEHARKCKKMQENNRKCKKS